MNEKHKHTECVFDICNYCGRNGGAWADLWEGGIITFGGMWHGDWEDEEVPTSFLPGGSCALYDTDDRKEWTFKHSDLVGGHVSIFASTLWFGVRGNIKPLLKRFAKDEIPKPSDFKDVTILAPSELDELLEER